MLSPFMVTTFLAAPPTPIEPLPSPRHLAWHRLETYAFVHFGPNTFMNQEWGSGREDPSVFNPTALDCRQWAKTFRDAGLNAVIITAKHHDGFCLWPTEFSTHSVKATSWKSGKGDVLKDLSDACREFGLKFGVYLSPWDRNHPTYGTPEYNVVFQEMLREVLTRYGEVSEVWFDGANGEGPNGKRQIYDWPAFHSVVRKYAPNAVIFSDAGPDIRWVGNESGHAAETNWCLLERDRFYPGTPMYKELTEGHEDGTHWVPAECDVSIRPGWFYRESEDPKVKTVEQLMDIYYRSVGQNGSLLLNVPPDKRGLIHEIDAQRLLDFKKARDVAFAVDLVAKAKVTATQTRGKDKRFAPANMQKEGLDTYWAVDDGVLSAAIAAEFESDTTLNRILLQEPIQLGQRIRKFRVEALVNGEWQPIVNGTTVGYKRILRFRPVKAKKIRITIEDARACPALARFAGYYSPI
ncbi:MAG: alpha-L-fucosidase [Armatimonadetes bacterium]|nr:glycoside hydrolase family 29 (alpha-L-fucosidase) [Armatimonadota bacterium]NOG93377.1 alpha-L-fucosidase [Armatimonadota bacterium]